MIASKSDLKWLIKLCRAQGVDEIDVMGVKIKLGQAPLTRAEIKAQAESKEDPYAGFPTGELTPDQLTFYSSGGVPADDPATKAS